MDEAEPGLHYEGNYGPKADTPTFFTDRVKLSSRCMGHLAAVYCVLYDNTGRYIFTGADDRLVKIWSAVDGRLLATLRGATAEITDMAINQENTLLAVGSNDKLIRVWSLRNCECLAVFNEQQGENTRVKFCPLSNTRSPIRYLASTAADGSCAFWTYTEQPGKDAEFQTNPIMYQEKARPSSTETLCASFSSGGVFMATGSSDNNVRVYYMLCRQGPQRISEVECHEEMVTSISWAHHGVRFISGSKDGTALVHRFECQQWRSVRIHCVCSIRKAPAIFGPENRPGVTMVAWNASDTLVFTATSDFLVKGWNSTTGYIVWVYRGHSREIYVIEPHPLDPRIICAAGHDGKIKIHNIGWQERPSGECPAKPRFSFYNDGRGPIFDCKFSPSGDGFVCTDALGHLLIFGAEDDKDSEFSKIPNDMFFHTDYRPFVSFPTNPAVIDEQTQMATHLMPPPFLVDSDGNPYPPEVQRLVPGRDKCKVDQLVPLVAVAGNGGREIIEGLPQLPIAHPSSTRLDLMIAELVAGNERGESTNSAPEEAEPSPGTSQPQSQDPDNIQAPTATWQPGHCFGHQKTAIVPPLSPGALRILETQRLKEGDEEEEYYQLHLKKSPSTLQLRPKRQPSFHAHRVKLSSRCRGHLKAVHCVLYDNTGGYIFTGADDKLVKVWSAVDGRLLVTLRGATAKITDMAINLENTLLAVGSNDKLIRVWSLRDGSSLTLFNEQQDQITSVNFCPMPNARSPIRYLASTGADGSCAFWAYTEQPGKDAEFQTKPIIYQERKRPVHAHKICASFSSGGIFLATGSPDRNVRVYYMLGSEGPQRILEVDSHKKKVDSISWAHHGVRFIMGSKDGTARLFRFECQQWRYIRIDGGDNWIGIPSTAANYRKERSYVAMVAWNADDTLVFTATPHWDVNAWDSTNGHMVWVLRGHTDRIYVIESHPFDPRKVCTAGEDGRIKIWHVGSRTRPPGGIPAQELFSFHNPLSRGGYGSILDCKFSPSGIRFAATDNLGHMLIFGHEKEKDRKFSKISSDNFIEIDRRSFEIVARKNRSIGVIPASAEGEPPLGTSQPLPQSRDPKNIQTPTATWQAGQCFRTPRNAIVPPLSEDALRALEMQRLEDGNEEEEHYQLHLKKSPSVLQQRRSDTSRLHTLESDSESIDSITSSIDTDSSDEEDPENVDNIPSSPDSDSTVEEMSESSSSETSKESDSDGRTRNNEGESRFQAKQSYRQQSSPPNRTSDCSTNKRKRKKVARLVSDSEDSIPTAGLSSDKTVDVTTEISSSHTASNESDSRWRSRTDEMEYSTEAKQFNQEPSSPPNRVPDKQTRQDGRKIKSTADTSMLYLKDSSSSQQTSCGRNVHQRVLAILVRYLSAASYQTQIQDAVITDEQTNVNKQRKIILFQQESVNIGYLLDFAIRLEASDKSCREFDNKTKHIYQPLISQLVEEYDLLELHVIGLLIGVRGTISDFFGDFRDSFNLSETLTAEIISTLQKEHDNVS